MAYQVIPPPRDLKLSCGAIAQLGERVTGSHEVRGSIPRSSTTLLPYTIYSFNLWTLILSIKKLKD